MPLRFLLFASLLALILALGGVSDAQTAVGEDAITPITTPTAISNSTAEKDVPSSSATITITWTTLGPPGGVAACENDQ